MGVVIASDKLVHNQADNLKTELNSGHKLRLFKNNFTPDSSKVLADFTEATFTGYAYFDLAGQAGGVTQDSAGLYHFDFASHTFTCTGGSSQTVYGWYIDDGTYVKLSALFAAPVTMVAGASQAVQVSPESEADNLD